MLNLNITKRILNALASEVSAASTSGGSAVPLELPSVQSLPLLLLHPSRFRINDWISASRGAMPTDVVSLVACVGFFFVVCLYIIHGIALFYAKQRLHQPVRPDPSLPGVSVIKPLVGDVQRCSGGRKQFSVDSHLRENLQSFFTNDYHRIELLFCVMRRDDPSVGIVEKLMKKYPNVDAKIFVGGEDVGLNPKINNMMPAYRAAKYPLVLISDSSIWMRPDAVLDMASTMETDPKMAIVTQTPFSKDRWGLAPLVEQVYFGTTHARIYLAGNCLNFICSTGMSSMMRKSALDECGGLQAFGGYLAEDYFFGKNLAMRGYKSAIASYPAMQNSQTRSSILPFLERITRWMQLRIAMLPHIILVEPLQDCLMSGIIGAWATNRLFGVEPYAFFFVHAAYWLFMDFNLIHAMQNDPQRQRFLNKEFLVAWLVHELTTPFMVLAALCNSRIEWRQKWFKLAWGGRISEWGDASHKSRSRGDVGDAPQFAQ